MIVMFSVVNWLQFSSLGIGSALQNPLTSACTANDIRLQRELLSTAVFALLIVGVILVLAGAAALPLVNWTSVFPTTSAALAVQIPTALIVAYLAFVSSVVLSFIGPLYAARQELHLSSVPALAAGALCVGATALAVTLDLGLAGMVCATVGMSALAQGLFAVWTLYFRGAPELRPSISFCSTSAWRALFGPGRSFLLLQVIAIASSQADVFILAQFVTSSAVTPYSVAQKVFVQVGGVFVLASGSMWSAYGDAKAAGDVPWIRRSRRTMERLFVFFYATLAVGMVVVGHRILAWWVGEAAAPSSLLIGAVACYYLVRDWAALNATLLSSLDVIRPQVWILGASALLVLGLSLFFVSSLGAVGLALGGALGFSLLAAWSLPRLATQAIRRLELDSRQPR